MKKQLVLLGALVLLFSFTPRLDAQENCSKNIICIDTAQHGNVIDFTARNLQTFEVTITIEFPELVNMTSGVTLPYTHTLAGSSSTKLFSLRQADKTRAWKWKYQYYWTFGSMHARHDASTVYSLPYPTGKTYQIMQGFGGDFSHSGDQHFALDWGMPEGAEICAAREGVVVGVQAGYSMGGVDKKYLDYANFVMIKHADGTIGEYDHFQYNGITVKVGQKVNRGDVIGYAGNVGFSSAPHLHFFVYRAIDGKTRESLPVLFKTEAGEVTLKEGEFYAQLQQTATNVSQDSTLTAPTSISPPTATAKVGKIKITYKYQYQGNDVVRFQATNVTVNGKKGQKVHFGFNIWQDKWLEWVGLAAQDLPYDVTVWKDAGTFYYPYSLLASKGDIKKTFRGCFYIVDTATGKTIIEEYIDFMIP
jgi:hypothetical protein